VLLRPRGVDFKIIGFYTGKLVLGIGLVMLLPMIISLLSREWEPAIDFVIGSSVAFAAGYLLLILCRTGREMGWMHGMLVVPIAWLTAMIFGAVPLYLSGHFASFLDAMFDAMSGFSTTGLALVQDLDHVSYGHNFWRHLTQFVGGQGIVVVVLTLMAGGAQGIYGMYVGEAREEKILPNLIQTARFIWLVSLLYLGVGTITLGIVGYQIGLPPIKALLHGMMVFIAAFDTGGFSPQSQSILYYHSAAYELATIPFMLAGAINFALYYALFTGRRRELFKSTEVRMFSLTIAVTYAVVALALSQFATYETTFTLFRRGFYQLISAHTGTGFMTIYGPQFSNFWGPLAMFGIIIAMGLGATVGSTAGGIKALRIMAMLKAIILEVRRTILPPSAVFVEKYHHLKKNVMTEKLMLNAFLIGFIYIATYLAGAFLGILFGYPFESAVFESVSATANVGLTSGITLTSMPSALKVFYIMQMWAGRLEFISILALAGFAISAARGK